MKISQLAAHLLKLNPQAEQGRLALYHYLKNLCQLHDDFSSETQDSFYDFAMHFSQWRAHKEELGQGVSEDLSKIGLNTSSLHAHQIQWLDIELDQDFLQMLETENQVLKNKGEKTKLIPLNLKDTLRLRINNHTQQVIAEVKSKLAYVSGPNLHLVRPHSQVFYSSELELLPNRLHRLRLTPLKWVCFQTDGLHVQANFLHGSSFSKVEGFSGKLEKCPELFWGLKKLERHFINPLSDPAYLELLEQGDAALQALKNFHPNSELIAQETLREAEMYRENLFPNDRQLSHLISELKFNLRREDAKEPECQALHPL